MSRRAPPRAFFATLAASDGDVELRALSVLDAERDAASPSFFSAFPAFVPELGARLSPDTLAYAGVGDPAPTFQALLAQASSDAPGIAEGFDGLIRMLDSGEEGVGEALSKAFAGEAALAFSPPSASEDSAATAGESDEAQASTGAPTVDLLAELADPDAAREALGGLQIPIAEALGGGFAAPTFEQTEVAGQVASTLQVSPTLGLAYSVGEDTLTAASSVDGLAGLIEADGGLAGSDSYRAAIDGLASEPVLIAYFDLSGLVSLGERFGLGADPVYARVAPEVRRFEGFGLTVSRRGSLLETDARLVLGDAG